MVVNNLNSTECALSVMLVGSVTTFTYLKKCLSNKNKSNLAYLTYLTLRFSKLDDTIINKIVIKIYQRCATVFK